MDLIRSIFGYRKIDVWIKIGDNQEAQILCDLSDNIYNLKEKIKDKLSPLFDHLAIIFIIIKDTNNNILEPDVLLKNLSIGGNKNNCLLVDAPSAPVAQEINTLKRKFEEDVFELKEQISKLSQQVEDNEYSLPTRYQDNVKKSSVIILNKDKTFAGVGFFVAKEKIITVKHNLISYGKRFSKVFAKIYNDNGQLEEVQLTMKITNTKHKFDLAIFNYNGSHSSHLVIDDIPSNGKQNLVMASFTNALSEQLHEIKSFTNDGFALIPSHLLKISDNYIVYLSVAFSGDSGGAVLFGPNGTVVAMHIETVNEANEAFENVYNSTNVELAQSINSIVKGLSSGFVGLRLGSAEIKKLLLE